MKNNEGATVISLIPRARGAAFANLYAAYESAHLVCQKLSNEIDAYTLDQLSDLASLKRLDKLTAMRASQSRLMLRLHRDMGLS